VLTDHQVLQVAQDLLDQVVVQEQVDLVDLLVVQDQVELLVQADYLDLVVQVDQVDLLVQVVVQEQADHQVLQLKPVVGIGTVLILLHLVVLYQMVVPVWVSLLILYI
jgi:hypothetical protein